MKKKCKQCGSDIKDKVRRSYCSEICLRSFYTERGWNVPPPVKNKLVRTNGLYKLTCKICNKTFRHEYPSKKYCEECQGTQEVKSRLKPTAPENKMNNYTYRKNPTGRYVYGWWVLGEKLPFYIGRGTGRRAWTRHRVGNDIWRNARCQEIINQVGKNNIVVRIIKDGLSMEGSVVIESVLIKVMRMVGAKLANRTRSRGSRRRKGKFLLQNVLEEIKNENKE